ncbi:MAG: prepilin-type N-terminal cleavage/methylation domain-containing protein [Candidatus Dojkabacteria bacterium]
MRRNKKGFTLIELMIGMAVTAIFIILGIVGIGIVQKNSRDVERNNSISAITNILNDYRKANLSFPTKANVVFGQGQVSIVGFKNYALKGFLSPASSSTNNGTRYFYNVNSNSDFVLCVLLESGSVKGSGTSQCPPVTSWF